MRATFTHEGLHLRTVEPRDLQQIADLRNDQSTWTQLTDPRPLGPSDQKAWYESLGSRSGKLYMVACSEKYPFIGLIRMDEIDHLNRSIRVGADVQIELRGKGFGKAIYKAVLKYCFDQLNMNRVWLAVLDTNSKARSLYKKMGFKEEGRYRQAIFRDGAYVDYILMSILKEEYFDKPTLSVAVIVFSYNRPRMLLEALESIEGADEVILLDDASNFDVQTMCAPYLKRFPRSEIRIASPISVEDRLRVARAGAANNKAIRTCQSDIITYLCDDDLFHPDWLNNLRTYFTDHPEAHCVRAPWGVFNDGEEPGEKLCELRPAFDMTTGNFGHLKKCCFEHGVWWDELTVAVHDHAFITRSIFPVHPLATIPKLETIAGWRREHSYNMMKFTDSNGYLEAAADVLRRSALE